MEKCYQLGSDGFNINEMLLDASQMVSSWAMSQQHFRFYQNVVFTQRKKNLQVQWIEEQNEISPFVVVEADFYKFFFKDRNSLEKWCLLLHLKSKTIRAEKSKIKSHFD